MYSISEIHFKILHIMNCINCFKSINFNFYVFCLVKVLKISKLCICTFEHIKDKIFPVLGLTAPKPASKFPFSRLSNLQRRIF